MQARFRKTKRQDRFDFLSANVVFGCRYEIAFVAIFSCGHATLKDASSVRQLVSWLVGPSHSSWKVGKRAFPPLPTRQQPKAVYPALFPLLSLLLLILHIRLDTSIHQAFVLAIYMVQISHIFLSFYVDFFTQFIHLPICTRQKWVIQTGTQRMKLVQTTILTLSAFVTMTRIE